MGSVEVIFPTKNMDALAVVLERITEALHKRDPDIVAHGILGGSFGYGGDWSSQVFDMRPYYWGDCDCGYMEKEQTWSDEHKHTEDCYRSDFKRQCVAKGASLHPEFGFVEWPRGWKFERHYNIENRIYKALCKKHGFDFDAGGYGNHCTCYHNKAWREWSKKNKHAMTCSVVLPNFKHHASGLEVRWYKYIGRGMETVGSADLHSVLAECLADISNCPAPARQGPLRAQRATTPSTS